MHPNARHGVEILEAEMKRKKRAKKEKKAKKAKKKKVRKYISICFYGTTYLNIIFPSKESVVLGMEGGE